LFSLAGFKWIGNESLRLQSDGYKVLFSYEEALGYCVGDAVCDKDGISAAIAISDLANTLYENGSSLVSHLHDLQSKYGLFVSYNTYVFSYDKAVTGRIFSRLRGESGTDREGEGYWSATQGVKVTQLTDVTKGYDSTSPGGRSSLPLTPESEMLMFEFENQCSIILRTSGTEPKIKCYSEIASDVASGMTEAEVKAFLVAFVEGCIHDMLEPHIHGLTRP
jgi:phosphomannomutase